MNQNSKTKSLLAPGHRGCAGCGQLLAARLVADTAGPKTIIANATGCLEVVTSQYPFSSWRMPWIHSLFENAPAVASGILAALKYQKKSAKVKVIAQGGDGGTFDIGFGLLSGLWARGEDILYICYNNEAYMNTGIQASGATPFGAATTTSPAGKKIPGNLIPQKNLLAIAVAHGVPYVAATTAGYPLDIVAKIKKALTIKGPKYLEILSPCVPGWGIEPQDSIKVGQLAHQTGLYPIFEIINGQISTVKSFPKKRPTVDKYLKLQKMFTHLFRDVKGKQILKQIQEIADNNIKKLS